MLVLDTNVVSELMRPAPAEPVLAWLGEQSAVELHTTSVTLAEVRYGLLRLPSGRRRSLLLAAADEVFTEFRDKVLPFDAAAATRYAEIVVLRQRTGTPISGFDGQIAAICRVRDASLVTRNTQDFHGLDLDLIDPWTAGS